MSSVVDVNLINLMGEENITDFTVASSHFEVEECLQDQGTCVSDIVGPTEVCRNNSLENVGNNLFEESEHQECCQGKSKHDLRISGSQLGDVSTVYATSDLYPHELSVIGTYVDPRITPGFCYTVRLLEEDMSKHRLRKRYIFGGQALRLQSIGAGYGKRITFASKSRNHNDNYFWSDTHPAGYGFAIQVVNRDDKFTIYDANRWPLGTCEVIEIAGPQCELSQSTDVTGCVEKSVKVSLLCKVEWYDCGTCNVQKVRGVAVVSRRGLMASIAKIQNVSIHHYRGLTLIPGVDDKMRRFTVTGKDVPTQYIVTGLEPYEIPVIGTFVDPRITPGFAYKVRPAHARRPLFQNRALTLLGIGMGYGKRLTFQADKRNSNNNILWSDSYPDGIGFAIEAISPGMEFAVETLSWEGTQDLGMAKIVSLVGPQVEESHAVLPCGMVEKVVRVDVICNLSFSSTNSENTKTVRISAKALLRKPKDARKCCVIGMENIGLGSQLNVMFTQSGSKLSFRYRK